LPNSARPKTGPAKEIFSHVGRGGEGVKRKRRGPTQNAPQSEKGVWSESLNGWNMERGSRVEIKAKEDTSDCTLLRGRRKEKSTSPTWEPEFLSGRKKKTYMKASIKGEKGSSIGPGPNTKRGESMAKKKIPRP